ncbi:methyltransferase domain-containing protein [Asanoa sp. NPDC049518]|uniref:methyltransferase domain-containing protein n=1 Tax=unclassified Asanoa TaxID=2685164 RepID=UPI0034374CB2
MSYAMSASAAEYYESTFVPALFGPWARRAVAAAPLMPGMAVLDVACGTGAVARAAAPVVGSTGTVVGVDRNPAMLAVARRLRPELRWVEGDACALPFASGVFDVAISQAGLMFFGDRVSALRELGRVARRVVVQVPGRLSESAGYRALAEVVSRHAGPATGDLLSVYFSAGSPWLLADLIARAGLLVDRLETWTGATRLDSLDTFLAVELLPFGALDPEVHDRVIADCRTALARFVDADGAVAAPLEVQLVTARADGMLSG